MKNENTYKERYVAFIDILGFKNAIKDIPLKMNRFNDITAALEHLDLIKNSFMPPPQSETPNDESSKLLDIWARPNIQTFSDNIFISVPCNELALSHLGAYCALIYNALFSHGFFARGAITKGNVFSSENVVFGDGLIKAYELESKNAIYPRILISNSILPEIKQKNNFYICRDFDGFYYLDAFYPNVREMMSRWNEKTGLKLDLYDGRESLIGEYRFCNDENIKPKLYWLIQYFNSRQETHRIDPISNF